MLCTGCGGVITDRYILQVNGLAWHSKCLVCVACSARLDTEALCYFKESRVYCRADYFRQFGTKCSKCSRQICPTDWVRRAKEQVYHLACFACDACKRQLSTGEEFALAADEKVLCKTHFQELFDDPSGKSSNEDSCDDNNDSSSDPNTRSSSKSKTKRVRTTFTDEQLQVLQANFQIDSNPDGQDLERIAQITGLSKRVTQVWFQNSRARQKKHLQKQKRKQWPTTTAAPQQPPPPNQHPQPVQQPPIHHHMNTSSSVDVHHHHHRQFEKTSAASQLEDEQSAASPLTMLYTF